VIVVFRDPITTAESIIEYLEEGASEKLNMSFRCAMYIVKEMYNRVIGYYRSNCYGGSSKWLFVHQKQVLNGAGLGRLVSFTGKTINRSFPEPSLTRSVPEQKPLPVPVQRVYRRLCNLAGFGHSA
jgi:hypothetical protein